MDEITLFKAGRPAAPEFADHEREHARGLLTAAALAEQTAVADRGQRRHRQRWLVATSAAAAVAVAAFAAVAARHPGEGSAAASHPGAGPEAAGLAPLRADPHALAFTTADGYITVIVRDPLADQASYNAEFKAHGLDITLSLVPVSPSLVGTVADLTTYGPGITTITAKGRCWTGDGGSECPVGLRIPLGFRGQATLVFGRAARPGEQYEETTDASAPGEVMHGLAYQGKTVATVLDMLRARHVTVPTYRGWPGTVLSPAQVPGSWFVYDAVPWAPQQVLLFVGATPAASPPGRPGDPTPRSASAQP